MRSRSLVVACLGLVFLAAAGLIVMPAMMMVGTVATVLGGSGQQAVVEDASCTPAIVTAGRTTKLTPEQLKNAGLIMDAGRRLRIPARGHVIALATALQESNLRNLSWGDRDSVGLFQQRNGWGSFAERTDPVTSASMFFAGGRAGQPGLLDISGWTEMPVTVAAQEVQRSAFPRAYAKWEGLAASLVRSAGVAGDVSCPDNAAAAGLPSGAVGDMMRVALAQLGDPYVWGATGPDAFDCSGLVVYSWRQAGYRLSVRTADQMYRISTPVRPGEERPGDLLFGSFGTRVPGAGHMMVVVRPGLALQAPRAGRNVELTSYTSDSGKWRIGRLPGSSLKPLGTTT